MADNLPRLIYRFRDQESNVNIEVHVAERPGDPRSPKERARAACRNHNVVFVGTYVSKAHERFWEHG